MYYIIYTLPILRKYKLIIEWFRYYWFMITNYKSDYDYWFIETMINWLRVTIIMII